MKFKIVLEQLISSETFNNSKDINFERLARNIKNTGFTDVTSFAMTDLDAIDSSGFGDSVLTPKSKGIKNNGKSEL